MTYNRSPARAFVHGTVDRAERTLVDSLASMADAVAGALADRVSRRRLTRMSDRVLNDMGLSRDTLTQQLAAARKARAAHRGGPFARLLAAWREEHRIYRELSLYSDSDLAELGMGRGDIRAAARGEAVLTFRDAGLVDSHFSADGIGTVANRPARRRAA